MSPVVAMLLSALAAYLLGSLPFSLWVAKLGGGIDLRKHGSGNVGATNVARTLGARWGLLALALDIGKGILSVLAVHWMIPVPDEMAVHQRVLLGVMAVVGHMFSPWLKFRGGKGVATALGAVIILAPWPTLFAFLAFFVVFVFTRIVSLCSIVAAITFAAAQLSRQGTELWSQEKWSLGVFSVVVPLLIILRHRANIVRLLKGEEKALSLNRDKSEESEAGETSSRKETREQDRAQDRPA